MGTPVPTPIKELDEAFVAIRGVVASFAAKKEGGLTTLEAVQIVSENAAKIKAAIAGIRAVPAGLDTYGLEMAQSTMAFIVNVVCDFYQVASNPAVKSELQEFLGAVAAIIVDVKKDGLDLNDLLDNMGKIEAGLDGAEKVAEQVKADPRGEILAAVEIGFSILQTLLGK